MASIQKNSAAVIGLGYVGLPLSQLFLQNGFIVHGIDINQKKLESIEKGESLFPDVDSGFLQTCIREQKFSLFQDGEGAAGTEAVLICVPTPLTGTGEPDLSYVNSAVDLILPHIREGQLIVLESTSFPGTTEELILPKLEKRGFRPGENLYLAYSPERIDPGSKIPLENIPKVVGGITPSCLQKAKDLYERIFVAVHPVSSARAAEMTKILENTQRFINISFINDFALLCEKMGIDVYEVIDAAATKPYGFTRYLPGAGIGGHCIPIDPLYLSWKAKQFDHETPFIHFADRINKKMPAYIAEKVLRLLAETGGLAGKKILVAGVAYKKDIDDVRESAAVEVIRRLMEKGAAVDYFDPLVPELTVGGKVLRSADDPLSGYDLAVVITEHSVMDREKISAAAKQVIFPESYFLPWTRETDGRGGNK
jgi:UDP-N-acetyl-D-glucosamine dehydrogenase